MRVEVVEDNSNLFCLLITLINEPSHLMCEVCLSPSLCHFDMSPACLRLTDHKQVARALALILVIITMKPPRSDFHRRSWVSYQLPACLVKVHFWALFVIFFSIQVNYILHRRYKRPADFRDAP